MKQVWQLLNEAIRISNDWDLAAKFPDIELSVQDQGAKLRKLSKQGST